MTVGPVYQKSLTSAQHDGMPGSTAVPSRSNVRVLVIGSNCLSDSMESHVLDALRHLGCVVGFFAMHRTADRLGRLASHVVNRLTTLAVREPERLPEPRLMRAALRFTPSLVLVIQGNQVSPKTIERLRRRLQVPIVCWCQDSLVMLGRQYLLGAGYDAVFVKDRYMHDLFSRMVRSTSFFYLPEACNPRVHKPVPLTDTDRERYGCEVMIAGSLYYYRQDILQQLQEFDLKVWGSTASWMIRRLPRGHMGREVILEEKARAARAARIALNPLHYGEVNSLNCRAFELAGCGAFQLMSERPVLTEHFQPGAEVATYNSIEDLIEKIRYYLNHPLEAAAIANRGQLRAHRDHTYEQRLAEILRISLSSGLTAGRRTDVNIDQNIDQNVDQNVNEGS